MLRRLLKTIKRAREPENVKRARNAAEIVARGAALTLNHVELDYRRLPAFISTKLVGYLHGYSSFICTSWAVQDPGIAIGATMFAIESIFPERREFFIELLSAESLKSAAFVEGGKAGWSDAERMIARKTGSVALLDLLVKDFKAFCNYREAADFASKIHKLEEFKPEKEQ